MIYFVDQTGIKASDLGEAILGLSQCLKEAANLANLDFDDVFILPIERGSVKTVFIFIQNQRGRRAWDVVIGLGVVFALVNDGMSVIEKFGANAVRNQEQAVIQTILDPRVIKLCQSSSFRDGAKDVVQPLSEINQKVTIKYGEKSFEINCDNKYQFYESDEQEILPELIDGEEVTLNGEITRINNTTNDLGFVYKGKSLSVSPSDGEKSIADYHQFLTVDEVTVQGIVSRSSKYETPKIKITEIHSLEQDQLPFNFLGQ